MGVGRNKALVADVAEAERARMPWLLLTDEETGTSWLVLDAIARADEDEAERARMPWLLLTDEKTGTSWLVLDAIARADEDPFGVDDEGEMRRRLEEADREEETWDAREAREGTGGR